MNNEWISVVTWKRTSCGSQLGMFCLHCLFVCCGSLSWFSLSSRLRQDCQFPYASYLENMRWHQCLCLHLSVIYYMSYTSDLSSHWYVTQMLSCLFPSCSSDHRQMALAHGATCRSDGKVRADWLQCVSSRKVQILILQSQPLSHFYCDWKAYYYCLHGLCCALYFIKGSSPWWAIACQLKLWLTAYESINKYDLILIKSDKTQD